MSDSEQSQASGEGQEKASGTPESVQQRDSVAYDTYRKVLSEKKKRDEQLQSVTEELTAIKSQMKEKADQELKDQNRYKELYESTVQENQNLKSSLSEKDTRWNNALKLDAFYKGLNGKVIDSKYSGFINVDNILVDPDTGSIDTTTVQREIERVTTEYPEIVKGSQSKPLPAQAPVVNSGGVKSLSDLSKNEKMQLLSNAIKRKREENERLRL